MTAAIEAIVDIYVKQKNFASLERLKSHREDLLAQFKQDSAVSFDVATQSCQRAMRESG